MNTKYSSLFSAQSAGFTLMELLVVILIIGILAGTALPQYQKAVVKSQSAQALTMLKSVAQAYSAYYMANGQWASSFDDPDIQVPWTGGTAWKTGLKDTPSSQDWSLQLQWFYDEGRLIPVIYIGRLTGAYAGTGFAYFFEQWDNKANWRADPHFIYCVEQTRGSGVVFTKTSGDFCQKVMGTGRQPQAGDTASYYLLP